MSRNIVRHIGMGIGLLAMVTLLTPIAAQAKTYYVKYRVRVCTKTSCHYVYRYKYVSLAIGTPKGVISYKPAYNVMSVGNSRSGVKPKGATAVCADGKFVYTAAVTSACAAHHGVAWKF